MKKIILALLIGITFFAGSCSKDESEEEAYGSIYGVVTDSKTAEPMRSIGVELYRWGSLLLKTVTFDDGHFEFDDLEPDYYELRIVADGYSETVYTVLVEPGRTARADMQVSKQETYMTVNTLEVEDPKDGFFTFNGEVSYNPYYSPTEVGFIYGQSKTLDLNNGTLIKATTSSFNCNVSIKELGTGTWYVRAYAKNKYGNEFGQIRQFEVKLLPVVKTLDVTNIYATTATLNGQIVYEGDPKYTEKGFVYSSSFPMPTIDDPENATTKVSISGNSNEFSANISGLIENKTYHVRTYAKCSDGIVYGDAVSFKAESYKPYVIIDNLAIQRTDISSGTTWKEAVDLCSNSRVGGFSDWRLPTLGELSLMHQNKTEIGGFYESDYWSSTISRANYYYYIDFYNGHTESCYYTNTCRVRAVRTVK